MIKVVVIDHYLVERQGLCLLIEQSGIQVIGSGKQEEGVELALSLKPDVVIVSTYFRDIFDLEAAIRLLSQQNKVLVLSKIHDFFSPTILDAGAFSYVTADANPEEFIHAVKETAVNQHIIRYQLDFDRSQWPDVSLREIEVLQGILSCMTIDKIAKKLNLAKETIRNYRIRILQKLNLKNDIQLSAWALKKKIVMLEDVGED